MNKLNKNKNIQKQIFIKKHSETNFYYNIKEKSSIVSTKINKSFALF